MCRPRRCRVSADLVTDGSDIIHHTYGIVKTSVRRWIPTRTKHNRPFSVRRTGAQMLNCVGILRWFEKSAIWELEVVERLLNTLRGIKYFYVPDVRTYVLRVIRMRIESCCYLKFSSRDRFIFSTNNDFTSIFLFWSLSFHLSTLSWLKFKSFTEIAIGLTNILEKSATFGMLYSQ